MEHPPGMIAESDPTQDSSTPQPSENPLVLKAQDLLALAEKDRRKAEETFEKLGFDTQLDTAMVLTGDQLQDWLHLSEDCTELVRSLPPEHLHQAIKLIGEEDALTILASASSVQLQAMMDLEWFTDNKLDRRKVRKWAELFLELPIDEIDEAIQGIDPNAMAEFLRPYVKPKVSRDHLLLAIHMRQAYLFTPSDLDTKDDLVERLLDFLYAADRDYFAEILELLIAEDEKIVAADVVAGREDRMIQRGFPALAKAEALLQVIDFNGYGVEWPRANSLAEAEESSTALSRTAHAGAPFLLHALAYARSKDVLNERSERAFIREAADLANSILLVHGKEVTAPGVRKQALAAVQVLAGVGLEAVCDGNIIVACERLKAMDTVELFRLGWSMTRTIAQEAWHLVGDPRAETLNLAPELRWLPEHLRRAVMDAEQLMDWRNIAETYVPTDKEEQSVRDALGDGERSKQELLTWPRLCALIVCVETARDELEIKANARKAAAL